MLHNKRQSGFTLIELMLAMTFLSFILVFMALTLVQMLRTYDKGLTVKQINQAGRTITEDISKSIRGEQPGQVVLTAVPNGRLCIGNIMYVWNPVYVGARSAPTPNPSPNAHVFSNAPTAISMARIKLTNPTNNCAQPASPAHGPENYSLLGDRARVVWAGASPSPDGRLVRVSFVLGTYDVLDQPGISAANYTNVFNTPTFTSGEPTCKSGSDGNYCAFAEFSTIVYLPNGQ